MGNATARMDAIDTEIALTALLASAVASYPRPGLTLYPLFKLVAGSLLVITLVRRLAIMNGLTSDHRLIHGTTHLLDVATDISVLYLSYIGLEALAGLIWPSATLSVVEYSAGVIAGVYVLYGFLEVIFATELAEGERIFTSVANKHRGEVLGVALRQFTRFVSQSRQTTVQTTLSQYYDRNQAEVTTKEYIAIGRSFIRFGLTLVVIIIGYSGLTAVGAWLWGSGWTTLPLVVTVLLISGLVRLWYSNYGLIPVEERNGFVTFAGEVAVFFLIGQWLLG